MKNLKKAVQDEVGKFAEHIEERLPGWCDARDPTTFLKMEQEVHRICRSLADDVVEQVLKFILAAPEFQAETARALRDSGRPYRDVGRREVPVCLLGGKKIRVRVEYFRRDLRGRPGRKRRHGRRGKAGAGIYPALAALGIWFMTTPALASEVVRQVADSDSVRTARAALARRDINLGQGKTLAVVDKSSQRAVAQRNEWLQRMRANPATEGPLANKRVVIATDGGRLRERRDAKRGRKRAKTGRRGYRTPWREPKMLVIYVVDDQGEQMSNFRPVYDATLQDCEAVFQMLVGYLKGLGAHQAKELLIVGDGAKWIWGRVDDLVSKVGIEPSKVTEVIDWYHAVETLHTIASYPAKWIQKQRDKWTRKAKRLLHAGKIDALLKHIDELAVGRRAKAVRKHRNYFLKNKHRMQYKNFEESGILCGSGAVESAIRRVVNQRMKGSAKFWKESNAEGMLLMRSYLKADRLDDLMQWSLLNAAPWWKHEATTWGAPVQTP